MLIIEIERNHTTSSVLVNNYGVLDFTQIGDTNGPMIPAKNIFFVNLDCLVRT